MTEWGVAVLLLVGGLFTLLAGVGVVRLPDLLMRMQAATKAGTLGVGCTLLALILDFGELGVTTRAILVIGFLFLTAPVAAHMIARASYFVDVPRWEGTVVDELRDHYDRRTHALRGVSPENRGTDPKSTAGESDIERNG